MEPEFYRGDIVAVEKTDVFGIEEFNPYEDVQVGDIVVYNAIWYDQPVIHRVISEGYYTNGSKYFIIQGDNNNSPDPYVVNPDQITSKVMSINDNPIVIPKIGYVTLWTRGI